MPSTVLLDPPAESEYSPYYGRYIARVAAGDVLAQMAAQLGEMSALLAHLTEDEANARYAPGKWSVKEALGHVADTERVFSYRALRIARGDQTPLPGFDQDAFMTHSHFDSRPLASLLEEWEAVRRSTLALFRGLPADAFERAGTASEAPVSVRALAYIIAGHVAHHLNIFRTSYHLGA